MSDIQRNVNINNTHHHGDNSRHRGIHLPERFVGGLVSPTSWHEKRAPCSPVGSVKDRLATVKWNRIHMGLCFCDHQLMRDTGKEGCVMLVGYI